MLPINWSNDRSPDSRPPDGKHCLMHFCVPELLVGVPESLAQGLAFSTDTGSNPANPGRHRWCTHHLNCSEAPPEVAHLLLQLCQAAGRHTEGRIAEHGSDRWQCKAQWPWSQWTHALGLLHHLPSVFCLCFYKIIGVKFRF